MNFGVSSPQASFDAWNMWYLLITYVAMGATVITKADESYASGSRVLSIGLRKGVPCLMHYPETWGASNLPLCSSSHCTSCLSGSSIQNPWQEAVPINIFCIGRILQSSEILHIWPLGKAESDLVCQILCSHEKWKSHFALLHSPLLPANQPRMLSGVKHSAGLALPWQQLYPKVASRSDWKAEKGQEIHVPTCQMKLLRILILGLSSALTQKL